MARIDYDTIAPLYDEPARDHLPDDHLLEFLHNREDLSTVRIVDIGCGTGKQLAANRQRLPLVTMIGLDRFHKMLRLAQQRSSNVAWVQADGASLPLQTETCDFVTSQFSYPHVRNPRKLLEELFRVLRPGGRFIMTNIDPWSMTDWAVYRYFPDAFTLDLQDFLPVHEFAALMQAAGFRNVSVHRDSRPSWPDADAFLAFASQRHRASQLMAISDNSYAAGLQRLERDVKDASNVSGGLFTSAFVLVTIAGEKR